MISKGNHVNFARLVLLAVCEEAETRLPSFCVQCIIKQLLDSVFVISRIIKVSVRVISLSLRLRLITRTSTLIILDITKTSSNNCLQIGLFEKQLGINCAREQIGLFSNFHEWLPQPDLFTSTINPLLFRERRPISF